MRKILSILCLLFLSQTVVAQSGNCGSYLTWTLADGTLTIQGTGAMNNYSYSSPAPWNSYRSSISAVVLNDGVTTIGGYAFYDCGSLTTVTIPESVQKIEDWAFSLCNRLSSVQISSLEKWCKIDFGSFDANPLYYARQFVMEGSVVCDLVIPQGLTSISPRAFTGCSTLVSVHIPTTVTNIGDGAFSYCSNLSSIDMPNSVTLVGDEAFYGCSGLETLRLSSSLTALGNHAFRGCSKLTTITIPSSTTSIGDYAFAECRGLTSVYSEASTPPAAANAFSQSTYTAATLYVPFLSVSVYKAANGWKNFALIDNSLSVQESYPGDLNGDGRVDVGDLTSLVSLILDNSQEGVSHDAADLNGDGLVNVADYTFLVAIILNGGVPQL